MKNNNKNSIFLSNLSLSLKKKISYKKKTQSSVSKLTTLLIDNQAHKKLSSSLMKSSHMSNLTKQGFGVVYVLHFCFSSVNTFFYVTDSLGNLKFRCSAGLMGFKGKQKRNRFLVLKSFFKEIRKLKFSTLKNKSISLNFTNVGFHKYFIVKKLKPLFFIQFIKSYQTHPYNGCRKRKRLRKK